MAEQSQKKIITDVRLLGIEKRYVPNKHYLYILLVKWSEGSEFIIYRRYSAFFQLHETLTELFPLETGVVGKKHQKIPPLPKQKWFGNEKFKLAESRQATIDDYCRKIAMAEPKISEHDEVLSFFASLEEDLTPPTPDPERPNRTYYTFESKSKHGKKEKSGDDLEISAPMLLETYRAIATFTPGGKTEVGLKEGAHVDVVDKNMSGWWLVQVDDKQGWCPASYLEPLDQPDERDEGHPNWEGEVFLTTQQYKAQMDDEISFDAGVIVHVIHKLLDGWWIVRYNDKVGYAPGTYLQTYTNPHLPLHKARARIDSDTATGSFIRKLPPRRSTIRKRSTAHKKAPKQRDLQMYRQKTMEASSRAQQAKGSSKLEAAREAYRRRSYLIEEEEPQAEETYKDNTGTAGATTDAQGYLPPDGNVSTSTPSYMNDSETETIGGGKSKTCCPRCAYVDEEALKGQGATRSAFANVSEEGTTPTLLLPEGRDDSSNSTSPRSGRSSGRSSPRSGRVSPSIPARPSPAEIAAKCSLQTKLTILQPQAPPDICIVNSTQEEKPSNKNQEPPISPITLPPDAAVIHQITAMIDKSSPNISSDNQRQNHNENTKQKSMSKGPATVSKEEKDYKDTETLGDDIKKSTRVLVCDGPITYV